MQGSGVVPVAFIVFTDDLVKLIEQSEVHVKLFADDVNIYIELCDTQCAPQIAGCI